MPKRSKDKVHMDQLFNMMKELQSDMEIIKRRKEESEDENAGDDEYSDASVETTKSIDKENEAGDNKENNDESEVVESVQLDPDCLAVLGDDPTENDSKQVKLHKAVANRWSHWFYNGLKDDEKQRLVTKYPAPENLQPPKLNVEISSVLNDAGVKRDTHFMERQKLATSALAILGALFNDIVEEQEGVDKADIIEKINDVAKLINQLIYDQSEARKAFILPGIEKANKLILTNSKTDEFLFGKNLKDRIKEAKAMEKIGQEMKQPGAVKPLNSNNNLNWNGPQMRKPAFVRTGQGNQPANSRPRLFFRNRQMPYNSRVKNQNRFRPRDNRSTQNQQERR